jgi:hypothetical protein
MMDTDMSPFQMLKGKVMYPDSMALWIRILDPDPGARKLREKTYFLVTNKKLN